MKAAARLLLVLALVAPAFALAQDGSAQAGASPAPTCRLFASNTIVGYNTKVRLDWSSKNATSGYLTAVGAIGPNGTAYVVPGKNTTYAASFTGPGGTIVCRVAIAVQAGWSAGSSGGGSGSGGTGSIGTTGSAPYSGGVVNINGTTDVRGSSIEAATPVSTGGSAVDTNNPVNTGGSAVDTGPGIDTNNPVNTSGSSIDTNAPVNLGGTGAAGTAGDAAVLPTAQSIAPSTGIGSGSGFIGGIVPAECRGKSTVANCDICSLAQMGQNLANFLLGLTIPAAALLFAWAGILYFSSRANPAQIERAHKIFKTVVIGVVIALSAWALVNTVMNMLIQGGDIRSWNWRELRCEDTRKARLYNMRLSDYLTSSLPSLSSYTGPSTEWSGGTGGCPVGSTPEEGRCIDYTGGRPIDVGAATGGTFTLSAAQEEKYIDECAAGNQASCNILDMVGQPTSGSAGRCAAGSVYEEGSCYNPITDEISDPTGRAISNPQMAAQIEAACSQISSADCEYVRKIALNESGGGRNCSTSPTGAAGCMQVLATTACGVDPSISSACAACSASRQSLSTQCAPVIETISNNQQIGVNLGVQYISNMQNMPALQRYHSQYGECQITAAAYYVGPGAVINAGGNINNIPTPSYPGSPSASQYVAKACR